MSSSEHFVRHHKQQTDRAIHDAYARLAVDSRSLSTFEELLHHVRRRAARLLEAPIHNSHHPGIEALVNLSRFENAHIRTVADWTGTAASWRPVVSSLAHHLLCQYKVPAFLASSWYSSQGVPADTKRAWFIAHARGASFRSLQLPIAMTRKMEHIFLASQDHSAIEHAIRRAELLALGASGELLQTVLSTRLAMDLSNGDFWRTVWMFLIANASQMDQHQIEPMIDFIQAMRHDRVSMETPEGLVELDPPLPKFSIKGRTVQSMLVLMRDWHRSLGTGNASLAWASSALRPMLVEEPCEDALEPPRRWQLTELTNSAQLRSEGAAMQHCVASYAHRCSRGTSRIWSLRLHRGEKVRHVLTIEVDPTRRAVIQARGFGNRVPSGKPLRLLQAWAHRERLGISLL